jgi:DNA-binding PadR family transcriptional regulator
MYRTHKRAQGRGRQAQHRMQGRGGHGRGYGRHSGDDDFGGDGSGGGGRQRRRRGDIKYLLLELIAEQPRHGYDLIKALEQRHAGFYRPSPGSVYPTLQLLEDGGYVWGEQVEGKKIYSITSSGEELLAERRADIDSRPRGPRAAEREQLGSLRQSATALFDSVRQVARHGSPEQVAAVQQIIAQARREVYRTLAQEENS